MKRVYTVKGMNGLATRNLALFELKGDDSTVYGPFRIENQNGSWVVVYTHSCGPFTEALNNCNLLVLKANGWQRVRVKVKKTL